MDRKELRSTLAGMLAETTGETYPSVRDDLSLTEGLGLDSVDLFTLVVDMQSLFRIKIASEELATVATVGDLLDLLQTKLDTTAATSAA